MSFHSWPQNLRSALAPGRGQRHHGRRGSHRAATHRLNLEALEDRLLLSFSLPSSYPVNASSPVAVATADFNNDGHLDLATANIDTSTVSVLLGDGAGGFAAASQFGVGASPRSLAVADFNNDGNLDLATAYGTRRERAVRQRRRHLPAARPDRDSPPVKLCGGGRLQRRRQHGPRVHRRHRRLGFRRGADG